jgi:hypothetical protein
MKPEITVIMSVVDMRLYEEDEDGKSTTLVFPPEDLEYGRVKSKDEDGDEEGEWRLVTVVWWHVFRYEDKDDSLVKGYGRVTVLEKYPQEVFHEFAFWDKDNNEWDSHDVHWEHSWVSVGDD